MFDTHCHLQFGAFSGQEKEVLKRAKEAGMTHMMMPGTDVVTSKKSVELSQALGHKGVKLYSAAGIHPHHVFQYQTQSSNVKTQNYSSKLKTEIQEIEKLLQTEQVIAVGEIGIDRHYYQQTKYSDYRITEGFIEVQKEVFRKQIQLAMKYNKSLILHNREAKTDLLTVLNELGGLSELKGRVVFHCCEPDKELLAYAQEHGFYIGVDGDVTYSEQKKGFIKKVPLEMLVLETDSPFLTPEPIRSSLATDSVGKKAQKRPQNEPKYLKIIAEYVAYLKNVPVEDVIKKTTENAKKLFGLD